MNHIMLQGQDAFEEVWFQPSKAATVHLKTLTIDRGMFLTTMCW